MRLTEPNPIVKLLVLLTYIGMVAVNAIANILPINGITTGDVSDAYPNLFCPCRQPLPFEVDLSPPGSLCGLSAGFFPEVQKYRRILLNQVGILFSISSWPISAGSLPGITA